MEVIYPKIELRMDEDVWRFFNTTGESLTKTMEEHGAFDEAIRQFTAQRGMVYERYALHVTNASKGVKITVAGIGEPIGTPITTMQEGTA
jgi:hypothetical protein